jgi:myo-inositol-1(or 4)-monophosphatase
MVRSPDQPVARIGRAPMAPGRERSGPPERRSLAPRSATITVMIRAAFAAAKSLKRDFGEVEHLQVSEKGPGDFVSHADIKAERTVRAELARTRPEYGFLGEEGGETRGDGRNRWIVDPLDGTTNFLHGVPHFAISIGLEREGEIIAGVVYQPISDELFWAEKGNGAFIDTPNARSRRLRVSGRKDPARALVGTGIPHIGKSDQGGYHAKLAAVCERTAGVRRWGAAALDLAFVAAGRYDAFFEFGLAPWDVAAGILLVREAGGVVSDIAGNPYGLGGPSLLASNFGLRESMVEILSKPLDRRQARHHRWERPHRPVRIWRTRRATVRAASVAGRCVPTASQVICSRPGLVIRAEAKAGPLISRSTNGRGNTVHRPQRATASRKIADELPSSTKSSVTPWRCANSLITEVMALGRTGPHSATPSRARNGSSRWRKARCPLGPTSTISVRDTISAPRTAPRR